MKVFLTIATGVVAIWLMQWHGYRDALREAEDRIAFYQQQTDVARNAAMTILATEDQSGRCELEDELALLRDSLERCRGQLIVKSEHGLQPDKTYYKPKRDRELLVRAKPRPALTTPEQSEAVTKLRTQKDSLQRALDVAERTNQALVEALRSIWPSAPDTTFRQPFNTTFRQPFNTTFRQPFDTTFRQPFDTTFRQPFNTLPEYPVPQTTFVIPALDPDIRVAFYGGVDVIPDSRTKVYPSVGILTQFGPKTILSVETGASTDFTALRFGVRLGRFIN